ncbi:MAG TPA: hypothetical protein VFQ88_05225 [Nevskiaceae bacterium]|nr:hypothetical protein [Nevskiaceae bacterium]
MALEAGLLIVALALEVAALVLIWRLRHRQAVLAAAIARARARSNDLNLRVQSLDELREDRQLANQFFGSSSGVVRSLQRGLTDLPTPLLENLPDAARVARELHQNVARDVVSAVSALGKAFRVHARPAGDRIIDAGAPSSSSPHSGKSS